MQIVGESEPYDLINEQLEKIRCSCKKDTVNYFVFNMGFVCYLCFSKLKGVESLQLLELAQIIDKSVTQYKTLKNSKNSPFNEVYEEIKRKHESIKKKREMLQSDMLTQKQKTLNTVENILENSLNINTNHALEQLFEPNLTVSSNLSVIDLLQRNLQNLKVIEKGQQIQYQFKQKDCTQINKQTTQKLNKIKANLDAMRNESNKFLDQFSQELNKIKK